MNQNNSRLDTKWVLTKINKNLWEVTHPSGAVTQHKTEADALKVMSYTIKT